MLPPNVAQQPNMSQDWPDLKTLSLPVSHKFTTVMSSIGNTLWSTGQPLGDLNGTKDLYRFTPNTDISIIFLDVTTLLPAPFCITGELYKITQITTSVRTTWMSVTFLISFLLHS